MFKRSLALAFLVSLLASAALASDFSATTWDEALALSKSHNKPILIDFFTEW